MQMPSVLLHICLPYVAETLHILFITKYWPI
jgi:hypothetical protein